MAATSTELELPEEIIQHIQSFVDGKEAAKTCLLSKSWYRAWSTRPILVFERFQNKKIQDYAQKTIKRYKDLSLKLDKLVVQSDNYGNHNFDELIADASTLGVTELDFKSPPGDRYPFRVFEITSLTKLTVASDFPIYHHYNDSPNFFKVKVLCSRLVSLKLDGSINSGVVRDILMACPLVENLSLFIQYGGDYKSIDIVCPRLVSLTLQGYITHGFVRDMLIACPLIENLFLCLLGKNVDYKPIDIVLCPRLISITLRSVDSVESSLIQGILLGSPLVENLDLKNCKMSNVDVSKMHNLVALCIQNCHHDWIPTLVSFRSINMTEFHKLRSVLLERVRVGNEFFTEFSSSFPHVEHLTLDHCSGYKSIRISSRSLKYFKLCQEKRLGKAEFHVPDIRKFVFKTTHDHIPFLCFRTKSYDWDAKVEFANEKRSDSTCEIVKSSWFMKLRAFLKQLRSSRISLSVGFKKDQLIWVTDFACSSAPVVQNLVINKCTSRTLTHDLLCALFRCCRPTLISVRNFRSNGFISAKLLYELFIINRNINANYGNCFSKSQSFLLYDLEEIDVETAEGWQSTPLTVWQSTPLTEFVENVDLVTINREQFRFRLKWGALRCI